MNQATLEALLGRPLTPVEVSNRETYLNIAKESLRSLLCSPVGTEVADRTFDVREGYRTVFLDFFTAVNSVKIDGVTVDPSEYSARQWDNRNAEWFNSIVFKDATHDCEIIVNADWGFEKCMPTDLKQLYAGLFGQVSAKNTSNRSISSKQVEDFRITFSNDKSSDELFLEDNASVISKYSLCNIGYIKHGEVC